MPMYLILIGHRVKSRAHFLTSPHHTQHDAGVKSRCQGCSTPEVAHDPVIIRPSYSPNHHPPSPALFTLQQASPK